MENQRAQVKDLVSKAEEAIFADEKWSKGGCMSCAAQILSRSDDCLRKLSLADWISWLVLPHDCIQAPAEASMCPSVRVLGWRALA